MDTNIGRWQRPACEKQRPNLGRIYEASYTLRLRRDPRLLNTNGSPTPAPIYEALIFQREPPPNTLSDMQISPESPDAAEPTASHKRVC